MRNLIINGAMQVWQRGTSFTDTTAGGNFYTADRWGANRAGDATGITISRSTSAPSGFQYSLALQRTAGNSGVAGLYLFYSNETVNSIQYQGQSIVLSFYAKAGANYSGGSLSLNVNTGTGTDQRVYAYTGSSTIISSSQSITTTWTRYTFTGTVPSNATEIGFNINWTPTGTAGADDAIYITGVQLERGTVATPFEYRNYQQELAMCQRYYYKNLPAAGGSHLGVGFCSSTTAMQNLTNFPVPMRTNPTALEQSGTATDYRVLSSAGNTTCSAVPAFQEAGYYTARTALTVASGLTAGQGAIGAAATTAGYLAWSAEL